MNQILHHRHAVHYTKVRMLGFYIKLRILPLQIMVADQTTNRNLLLMSDPSWGQPCPVLDLKSAPKRDSQLKWQSTGSITQRLQGVTQLFPHICNHCLISSLRDIMPSIFIWSFLIIVRMQTKHFFASHQTCTSSVVCMQGHRCAQALSSTLSFIQIHVCRQSTQTAITTFVLLGALVQQTFFHKQECSLCGSHSRRRVASRWLTFSLFFPQFPFLRSIMFFGVCCCTAPCSQNVLHHAVCNFNAISQQWYTTAALQQHRQKHQEWT